jgi:hypothetical protein
MFEKLSQALMGNKNAAGPRKGAFALGRDGIKRKIKR